MSLNDLDVLFSGETFHLVCGELPQAVPQDNIERSSSSTADLELARDQRCDILALKRKLFRLATAEGVE